MHQLYKGHFLIAAPHLKDPNFERAVVLILEHTEESTMGLVINRPSQLAVSLALSKHFKIPPIDDKIFVGGPVEPSALCILHDNHNLDLDDTQIVPGVLIGSCPDTFEEVVNGAASGLSNATFRIYSGYAGWGNQQLESEIQRGDWYAMEATAQYVFNEQPHEIWQDLLDSFSSQYRYWPTLTPTQAECN